MRKITIIGGGQSGLQLAIGLLKAGNSVRVVQNRTAEDIATGKVLSSQCMFHNSVEHERELGIDFWSDTCPPVDGINFQVPAPDGSGQKAIDWTGRLDHSESGELKALLTVVIALHLLIGKQQEH